MFSIKESIREIKQEHNIHSKIREVLSLDSKEFC